MSATKAVNAQVSEEFEREWRMVVARSGREQVDVFREYLTAAISDYAGLLEAGVAMTWAPRNLEGGTLVKFRLHEEQFSELAEAVERTRVPQADWLRVAMWCAVRNRARPLGPS